MTRSIHWLFLLFAAALAWSILAGSPPNLEKTLAAQEARVEQDPRNPSAWNDLGNLLVLAGRSSEGEQAYRQALSLAPNDSAARFNLALLLDQLGQSDLAEEELRHLIEIHPGHAWAHYQLGTILAERRNRDDALEHYAKALAYDPFLSFSENNPHIIDNPLFSEALLLSSRYAESAASRVPRQYGEPARIVELMLESEDASDKRETSQVDDEDDYSEGGGAAGGSDSGSGGGRASFEDGPAGTEPRPLRETPRPARQNAAEDLRSVTVGGAPPAGSAVPGSSTSSRRPSASGRRIVGTEDTRTGQPKVVDPGSTRPGSTRPGSTTTGSPSNRLNSRSENAAPPPPPSSRRSSRYIPPSRRSTSQLELKLLPQEPPTQYARLDPRR